MPAFRRVDARQAGPNALGILVPQGARTVVILRPRSLAWDLLPLRPGMERAQPAVFCEWGRDEAAAVARRVQSALERGAGRPPNPVEVVGAPPGERYGVCAHIEGLLWIACQRVSGQVYQPWFDASLAAAEEVAARFGQMSWPA